LIGAIGLFSGYFYSAPPLFFAGRGLGEIMVGLNFGILSVTGSYYVQTHDISQAAIIASLPLSFLITAILFINEFPDSDADSTVGKKHWVVRLGKKNARWGFVTLIAGAYGSIISGVILNCLPAVALFSLPPAVFGVIAAKGLFKNYVRLRELIPSIKAVILCHLATGISLVVIFFIS
jgi:1,4-dihydroxy-2-naphthoate octaprenyltransferase